MPATTALLPAAQAGTLTLGGDLTVNRMSYGAMRITGKGIWGPPTDRGAALATLRRAVELGVNFIAAIKGEAKLNSPIQVANTSVTMLLLSNIAYFMDRTLHIDTKNGHIKDDPEAMKLWGREYENGWEVTI